MNKAVPAIEDSQTKRFFHGTRAELKPGDLIKAGNPAGVGEHVGEQDTKSDRKSTRLNSSHQI